MRTSALERPEAPLARAPCSSSTTRVTPREASAQAMLIPLTPPPTTTTSAVSAMVLPFRRPRAAALSAARLHVPGIERVAETVAQEVEARHRQRHHHPREDRHPRRRGEVALRVVQHVTPARQRRLDPVPEEAVEEPAQHVAPQLVGAEQVPLG